METPVQMEKYGATVWANPKTEALRRDECLCLHCESLGDCIVAKRGLDLCRAGNLAFIVTRCPVWESRLAEERKE